MLAAPALAAVTDINSVVIQERFFNDFPGSTLTTVNNFPTDVSFTESNYGAGGFANRHNAVYSADGSTAYGLTQSDGFDISFNVLIDAGSLSPRKEGGIRFDSGITGDGLFIVASDGEVAAFGGPLPFHSFGAGAYTAGTTAGMRVIYRPDDDTDAFDGDASTMEYFFNGVSSGQLDISNTENGWASGTTISNYLQVAPDTGNPGDFAIAEYSNIAISVPEPGTLLLLGLGGVLALRRRR
jgi:hypothetical protein